MSLDARPKSSRRLRPAGMMTLICVATHLNLAVAPALLSDGRAADQPAIEPVVHRVPPQEPLEALNTFEVLHGFRLELVAAEPLVSDPVAAAFDENGLLYVVEMHGYPYERERNDRPSGRVRILEDADSDGVYDRSVNFVDELPLPTGIAIWRGGAFVCAAPNIWYFKDSDGDHKADQARRVFTGFGTENVQSLANNLQWGLDNRIYGAGAANGGEVRPADNPRARVVAIRGRDFAFDPRTEAFDAVSGTAQFGNSFDDWGTRYVCSNSEHAQQITLPIRYLERNPHLTVPPLAITNAVEGGAAPTFRISKAEPWRVARTARRKREGLAQTGPLVQHDVFTSATGITVYRGAAYPPPYRGNLFVGEVQGNLIHRKSLEPNGVLMRAARADANAEFVRSTDTWFRPVNFVNAPDGTLFVLDMYRETVEHPHSIPDDIEARLDLTSGKDRGRIYRLAPPGFKVPPPPRLALATSEQLVAELANPNGWRRDTAQRLLVERQDHKATRSLRRMVRECEAPLARLHALWSLAGLDDLADDDILAGLNDPHPGIREHAIRLAESRLDGFRAIANRVRSLADDANIRVRLQVALSLGESPDPTVSDALTVIARRDGSDPWMRAAVLSSAMRCAGPLLIELLRGPNTSSQDDNPPGRLLHGLALIVGAHGSRSEIEQVLGRLADRAGHKAAPTIVVGLSEGLARSGKHLSRYVGSSSPAGELLAALLAEAQKTCRNPSADPDRRRAAIELLGVAADFDVVRDLFAQLLSSRQPPVIQSATIRALAGFDYADVSGILLANWSSYTPGTRSEVTEILLSRRLWIRPFLDAVAQGTVVAGQIAPARRERLTNDSDPEIRTIAQRLFNEIAPGPRAEALARFRPALALAGDARRGEKAFETAECINCHQIGKRGHPVGPNLATVQQRTPESLLEQILDPNREVLPNYLEYVVELDDGRVVTGIIVAETATSILLRRAQRNETAIARPSIQTIRSTGKSLMPEGLEQKLTVQDMADLLAFLAALHP